MVRARLVKLIAMAALGVGGCTQPVEVVPPTPEATTTSNPPRFAPTPPKRLRPLRPPPSRPETLPLQTATSAATPPSQADPEDRSYERQLSEWEQIWQSTNVRDFERYLERYPDGDFVAYARSAIEQLTPPRAEPPPPPLSAQDRGRLATLVKGRGVREAAPLKTGPGVHRIALIDDSGSLHPWHERVPPAWRADSVATTELALLLTTEYVLLGLAPANGMAIPRYRQVLEAQLLEARTASLLKAETFWADPRPVRLREANAATELVGQVPFQEVFAWLAEDVVTPTSGARVRSPGDGRGFYYDPHARKDQP